MCVPNAENLRSRRGRGVTPSQQTVRATITHGVVNRIFNALQARQLLHPISPASSVGLNLPRHGTVTPPPAASLDRLRVLHFRTGFSLLWFTVYPYPISEVSF